MIARKQICITGATGLIGSELIKELLKTNNNKIRVLSRKAGVSFPPTVDIFIGNLACKKDLESFLYQCDVLYHCAGELKDISLMRSTHIDGTSNLLELAADEFKRTNKKIHWVQLSSCGAYGPPREVSQERVISEKTPTNPFNEYEITKTLSDELVVLAQQSGKLTYSILRPSNVFTQKMSNQPLDKLVKVIQSKIFFYIGKPGAIANYIHCDDVVNALIKIGSDPKAINEMYNLSSDCSYEELAEEICRISKIKKPIIRVPSALVIKPLLILNFLLKKWIRIPELKALTLRTTYPLTKIETELNFQLTKKMPFGIIELINSAPTQ